MLRPKRPTYLSYEPLSRALVTRREAMRLSWFAIARLQSRLRWCYNRDGRLGMCFLPADW